MKCNDQLSTNIDIEAGAPQGSAISPTLYNLYVHDIPQPIDPTIGLAQFADDTCLCTTAGKISTTCKRICDQLNTYMN